MKEINMGYVTYCLVRYKGIDNYGNQIDSWIWITVPVEVENAETYLRNNPTFIEEFLTDNLDIEIIPICSEEMKDFLLSSLPVEKTY